MKNSQQLIRYSGAGSLMNAMLRHNDFLIIANSCKVSRKQIQGGIVWQVSWIWLKFCIFGAHTLHFLQLQDLRKAASVPSVSDYRGSCDWQMREAVNEPRLPRDLNDDTRCENSELRQAGHLAQKVNKWTVYKLTFDSSLLHIPRKFGFSSWPHTFFKITYSH